MLVVAAVRSGRVAWCRRRSGTNYGSSRTRTTGGWRKGRAAWVPPLAEMMVIVLGRRGGRLRCRTGSLGLTVRTCKTRHVFGTTSGPACWHTIEPGIPAQGAQLVCPAVRTPSVAGTGLNMGTGCAAAAPAAACLRPARGGLEQVQGDCGDLWAPKARDGALEPSLHHGPASSCTAHGGTAAEVGAAPGRPSGPRGESRPGTQSTIATNPT